jgi:hypothetical protein
MATRIPTAARNAAADAVVDLMDAGAAAGKIRIYTGAQPASANDAASGTLLVEIATADPAFGAAATGAAALASTPRSAAAVAAGTAGWFRMLDSNNNTVADGSVTATGGGGDLTLDNTSIASGQTVNITSLTYTQPAG